MLYTCPICGFDQLDQPPYDPETGNESHDICSSCGFEYGYTDDGAASGKYPLDWTREMIIKDYREQWIESGMKWAFPDDQHNLMPEGWDPVAQLNNIGIDVSK